MATEPDAADQGETETEWLSQDTLTEQQDQETSVLPESGAKVKYRVMAPEKFASLVDHYQIQDLADELGDVDPDASMDPSDVDPEDADMDTLNEGIRVMLFYRDVILPQIDRPSKVHWANPDMMHEPDSVDISELPELDKLHLVALVTGQDPKKLTDAAKDRAARFQG